MVGNVSSQFALVTSILTGVRFTDLGQDRPGAWYDLVRIQVQLCNVTDYLTSGNSGTVQARFAVPLPTKSFGASLRVLLYPSST